MSAAHNRITKAPVSVRAVIGRLNRKLENDRLRVHKARGKARGRNSFTGQYFIVSADSEMVVEPSFGRARLEELARENGALAAWEEMTR